VVEPQAAGTTSGRALVPQKGWTRRHPAAAGRASRRCRVVLAGILPRPGPSLQRADDRCWPRSHRLGNGLPDRADAGQPMPRAGRSRASMDVDGRRSASSWRVSWPD